MTTHPSEFNNNKKIMLWGAWYGSHNVGDQLLLLTISHLIKEQLGEVSFTVLTDNPQNIIEYTKNESECNFQILESRRQILKVVHQIASVDLFVLGGGVPFFQQPKHLAVMSFLIGLCKFFHTPYMTWAVSSQPVSSKIALRIFSWVLNGAQAITCRDDHTKKLFESCQIKKPVVKVTDSAFSFRPQANQAIIPHLEHDEKRIPERPLIALTPRTLAGKDNIIERHYRTQSAVDYLREISCFVTVLDWCWENNYQPIFVPMNTVDPDDDRLAARLCMQTAKHGDKALLIDKEIRPGEAPLIYRQCQASFVARVHGAVTSVLGSCPVIMYAFQPKHVGIMETMGLSEFTIMAANATGNETVQKLKIILDHREQLVKQIKGSLNLLRESAVVPAIIAAGIITQSEKNINIHHIQ